MTSIIQDKTIIKYHNRHYHSRSLPQHRKDKNNQVWDTKDFYPGFYTKTRRKINKKTD